MGFNKRFITRKNLDIVKEQGIQSLITYITNPDCLFIEDDYCKKVCDIVGTSKNKEVMIEKLIEIGFYEFE